VYIFDSEGRQHLDASGGAAVSCLGHNHPVTSLTTMDMAIGLVVFQKAGTSMSHLHVNDWGGGCIAEQELIREIQRKDFCAFYSQNLYNRNDEK